VDRKFKIGTLKHGPKRMLDPTPAPPAPELPEHQAADITRRRVLVKFPTRARPGKFLQCLAAWIGSVSGKHDVEYLITLDGDDALSLGAIPFIYEHEAKITVVVGHSEGKVHAVNRDLAGRDFDVLVVVSDDMWPQVRGWDARIVEDMTGEFPDLDGLVHYSDGYRADICTLPVMGKRLYDAWGYVYHPSYQSLWCDNEATAVARRDRKYAFKRFVLARHEHPANTRQPGDALNAHNDKFFRTDRETYFKRRAAGFPQIVTELSPIETAITAATESEPPVASDSEIVTLAATPDLTTGAPLLSILIPTVPSRAAMLEGLLSELRRQIAGRDEIEIRTYLDDGSVKVGAKRNRLVDEARGRYVTFVDDDDMVVPEYVDELLTAAAQGADCITFDGEMTTDGQWPKLFRFKLGLQDRTLPWGYERRPNHICAIRRDLAQKVRFPEVNFGEDSSWAGKLQALLRSEARIDKVLYHYRFSTQGSLTHGRARPEPQQPESSPVQQPIPTVPRIPSRGIHRRRH
jgi:hypothetical protein